MPIFIEAGLWGLFIASGLPLGALFADIGGQRLSHRQIAAVMGFGGGVLIAIVSLDLMAAASETGDAISAVAGGLAGAASFSFINWRLSALGAKNRNRCGECVAQPREADHRGSGTAIALGAVLDGIPEALVVGLSIWSGGTVGMGVVAGFFLANVPQGLSSAAGMKSAGRSRRYIYSVWTLIPLVIASAAGLGALLLGAISIQISAGVLAFAAGAVIAMLAEAMIPEAFDKAPPFIGLVTVIGYLAAFLMLTAH